MKKQPYRKMLLIERYGCVCVGCNLTFPRQQLTLDHIVPKSKWGCACVANLQLMCGPCNGKKANSPQPATATRRGHRYSGSGSVRRCTERLRWMAGDDSDRSRRPRGVP